MRKFFFFSIDAADKKITVEDRLEGSRKIEDRGCSQGSRRKTDHDILAIAAHEPSRGKKWSQLSDLNRGPTHYKCVALPLS